MRKIYLVIAALFAFFTVEAQSQQNVFSTPGTYEWVAPCDVSGQVTVEVWGAGAAGSGSGGGGGAYARSQVTVTAGATYTIIVGRGGGTYTSGGWVPLTQFEGENSEFYLGSSTHLVRAEGGGRSGSYRIGGRAMQSVGDVKFSGGNGGTRPNRGGGGGGSSAVFASNGNNGSNGSGGNGGDGALAPSQDGGNGGKGGSASSVWGIWTGQPGADASAPGGGGGQGGEGSNFLLHGDHGNGANGKVVITYIGSPQVCFPQGSAAVRPITRVEFGGVINTTSAATSSPRYENFCSPTPVIPRGQPQPLKLKGNTVGNSTNYFTVFIDLNGNGSFESTERFEAGTVTNSTGTDAKEAVTSITIPGSTSVGLKKMRIIKSTGNYATQACAMTTPGQIEDYTIHVVDPSATITSFTPNSGCIGETVTITGTNLGGATAVTFNGTAATTFTIVNATTITAVVPAGATTGLGSISVTTPTNTATRAGFTVKATPVITTISSGGAFCNTTNISASASGGNVHYQGTNANGETQNNQSTATVTTSGTYYFRAYNGTCWGEAKSVTVTIDQGPAAVTVSGGGTFCESAVITATGGGGYPIYFQGTTSGGTSTADLASSKEVTTSGTYYFRAMSECGWGPEGSVTVTVNPLPAAITLSATPMDLCGASGSTITASGGSGGTIYYQGTVAGGTSTADPRTSLTVTNPGTYYFRSISAAGCLGAEASITITKNTDFAFTAQPQDATVCVGGTATFTVAVNKTGVTYQWYRNGAAVAGATSASFTVSNAQLSDESYDIRVVVANDCGTAESDYVALYVEATNIAPAAQPTALVLTPGATSVSGEFTPSPQAHGYLVVRTNNATPPANPANGTHYVPGNTLGGGTVVNSGPETEFGESGLSQGTTYYYWIYAYNVGDGTCGPTIAYRTAAPLLKSIKTATTQFCLLTPTIYWAGNGSSIIGSTASKNLNDRNNWSLTDGVKLLSPPALDPCMNYVINLSTQFGAEAPDFGFINSDPHLELTGNLGMRNLTITADPGKIIIKVPGFSWEILQIPSDVSINLNGFNLEVFGNANFNINYDRNTLRFGDLTTAKSGTVDFKGDVTLGANNSFSNGEVTFEGSNTTAIFRGALTFGKFGGVSTSRAINAVFDNTVTTTVTWGNAVNSARFRNVTIGQVNSPQIKHVGVADNILGDLTINNSGSLELLNEQQWNRHSDGGSLTLNQSGRLVITGSASTQKGGGATIVAGSNFPSGFSSRNFASTSRVVYNGGIGYTQTIYNGVTYGNLDLRNGNSTGTALKTNSGVVQYAGTLNVEKTTRWNLGANVNGTGTFNVLDQGELMTNTRSVLGTASFNLQAGGTLGIGSPDGISSSGATGNIQTSSTRSFSNDAIYIYNGTAHQRTGTGLPTKTRELEISNAAHVELTNSTEPVQLLKFTAGNLEIKNNTLTLNKVAYGASSLVGSDVSSVAFRGNEELKLVATNRGNYLKELKVWDNASARLSVVAGDTVNITGGLAEGQAGHVKLHSGATLTTNGNLTLKSNKFGTASLAAVEGTGANQGKIVGSVTAERYINSEENGRKWLFLATPTGHDGSGQSIVQSWMENKTTPPGYGVFLTDPSGNNPANGWDRHSPAPSIKSYNPATNGWVSAGTANRSLYNPNGWMVFVRGERSITGISEVKKATNLRSKGSLFIGDKTFSIPADPTNSTFYAIGNPYASAVDMRKVLPSGTDYYVWNPSITGEYGFGAYQTFGFDGEDYVIIPDTTFELKNNNLLSGQAFLVQQGAAFNVTFKESAKVDTSANLEYFRQARLNGSPSAMLRSNILMNRTLLDGTLHMFADGFSDAVDGGDARKMSNTGVNLASRKNGFSLIIERRAPIGVADTIFYNLTGAANGSYEFAFNARDFHTPGLEAFLEDAFTGARTPVGLEGVTEIPFEITAAAASKAANRFRMVFVGRKPLPVTFMGITAVKDGGTVQVGWTVAQEQNVRSYVVMASADGVNFKDLTTVAANGSTEYRAIDARPAQGHNYYRIRSVDIDGATAYSGIAKVYLGDLQPGLRVFPNPITDGNVYLRLENYPAGNYKVRLLNPAGQVTLTRNFNHTGGNHTERIPWDYKMAHGNYHLEVTHPDGSVKVIVVMY